MCTNWVKWTRYICASVHPTRKTELSLLHAVSEFTLYKLLGIIWHRANHIRHMQKSAAKWKYSQNFKNTN